MLYGHATFKMISKGNRTGFIMITKFWEHCRRNKGDMLEILIFMILDKIHS
jgi:hypothetical protein